MYGTKEGKLLSKQPLLVFSTLESSLVYPSTVTQGEVVDVNCIITTITSDTPITGAEVNLIAYNSKYEIFYSYFVTETINGHYLFQIPSDNLFIGEWGLYPVIKRDPYTAISLDYYKDEVTGEYNPLFTVQVVSQCSPNFLMTSEGASFSRQLSLLENVLEGEDVNLEIDVLDKHSHELTSNQVAITISIEENNYSVTNFVSGKAYFSFNTTDFHHGMHNITIFFEGDYLTATTFVLFIDILPRFPEIELSFEFMTYLSFLSFVVLLIILNQTRKVYFSVGLDYEKVDRIIRQTVIFLGIFCTAIFGFALLTYLVNKNWSIVAFFSVFGILLLIYFFWFFKMTYTRITKMVFSLKDWKLLFGVFFFIIVFTIYLNFLFVVGTKIQWFDYYISKESINLVIITIPKIYWDIAISGFVSGFVLLIMGTIMSIRSHTKELKKLKEEIDKNYYPKQPHKLQEEIVNRSHDLFVTLMKGFLLWFCLIIYSIVWNFKLFAYVPCLYLFLFPLLLPVF